MLGGVIGLFAEKGKTVMKPKPLVSIVLGSFNRIEFLPLTINSIRDEVKHIPHEIIVVDGGSTDGSLAWLCEQKDVVTIVQHNRGEWLGKKIHRRSWGYFMNLAFKAAQGKYVCMLSDDCLLLPGSLANGIEHAEQELAKGRNIGAVAFYFRDWSKEQEYHVGYTLGEKMYVNHGLYLNEALKAVEYIDEETFFFYNGDGDLCLKMWQQGYEVTDAPDSYVEHYPHANVKVRKTNYEKYKQDVDLYLKKWEGIFYDRKKNNLGKTVTKSFDDPANTGALFEDVHAKIVAKHPAVLQGKSMSRRFTENLGWKFRAGVRKIFSRWP